MKKNPKISVIMPVYNTQEEYLREAIESILNQTYSDFEFIILNDGSTNNSKEVILSYTDSRIKYYEHENQGISKTTNRMIKLATGEYIAHMDSDDISLPNRFETQINYLEKHIDIDIVSACYSEFPEKKDYIISEDELHVRFTDLLNTNVIPGAVSIIRRSFFEKTHLRYNESFDCAQDYEFWSRAIRYAKIVVLKDILYKYRILKNSNSHSNIVHLQEMNNKIHNNMVEFLTDNKDLQSKILEMVAYPKITKYEFFHKMFTAEFLKFDNKIKVKLKIFFFKFSFCIKRRNGGTKSYKT